MDSESLQRPEFSAMHRIIGLKNTLRTLRSGCVSFDLLKTAILGSIFAYKVFAALPKIELSLSDGFSGRWIRDYMRKRIYGIRREAAACILQLPSNSEDYLRGRKRQALRTNLRKAGSLRLRTTVLSPADFNIVVGRAVEDNAPIKYLDRLVADEVDVGVENWIGEDAAGKPIAFAKIQIDRKVALIKYLVATEQDPNSIVRWQLSYDIFRSCMQKGVKYVVCCGLPELEIGSLYFQERLGFQVYKTHLCSEPATSPQHSDETIYRERNIQKTPQRLSSQI